MQYGIHLGLERLCENWEISKIGRGGRGEPLHYRLHYTNLLNSLSLYPSVTSVFFPVTSIFRLATMVLPLFHPATLCYLEALNRAAEAGRL